VPIDVETPESAGWWMLRLSGQLHDRKRQRRLKDLDDWYRGVPPLPRSAASWRQAYQEVHRHACSNFAELVAEAPRARMNIVGIRTSSDGDSTGDREAWRIWRRAQMPLVSDEVHRLFLRFGESFALVLPPEAGSDIPIVTPEDPRSVVAESDPLRPWLAQAGLKMYRDPVKGLDFCYLYRPGRMDVAKRDATRQRSTTIPRFGDQWEIDEDLSRDLPDGLMPLVLFTNRDGVAEFERHTNVLNRINRTVLERMTIATLQAFKQRGIKGLPDVDPNTGEEIDYSNIFEASPGALWLLPETAEIWESGQADLRPILDAIHADVVHLAATTQTPMHALDPGGENQSAEGASMAREGHVFKVKDRIQRVKPPWSQVMQTCFLWVGDTERADLDGIDVMFESPESQSLAERASAAAQARAAGVTWRTIMTDVMGFPPEQVDRMETERQDDLVFARQLAMIEAEAKAPQASTEPAPTTEPEPEDALVAAGR
jgi:hypothetical protein